MNTQTETAIMTKGMKVAKNDGNGEYYRGSITATKGNFALVYFSTKGLSRWCKMSNLDLVFNTQTKLEL